ncbi:hypothetical protein D9756_008396 [Leucocoprinus leucothites]|uniref:DUF4219 domain-containing protein n=1 Tax=Leucocoprinus leucothites TaxID=201217 RepID=A0A8H5CZZ0_9AGAR|nr:hypothetical protein D9756_008396 [Leucoagaricus leucothites]
MSSINNGASCIPVLQGPQNYQFWSMRMQGYLSIITTPGTPLMGWTIIQGIVPTLPPIASPVLGEDNVVMNAAEVATSIAHQDEEECQRNFLEQSAIGMLIQAVPDSMLHLIVQGDPATTWDGLQHLYGVQGPASVYSDFVHAISWSLPGNMDPAQSIAELESLFTRIEGMTTQLPEVIRAMILLCAVPQGMETLAQSILANQTQMSQLTWDLVHVEAAMGSVAVKVDDEVSTHFTRQLVCYGSMFEVVVATENVELTVELRRKYKVFILECPNNIYYIEDITPLF